MKNIKLIGLDLDGTVFNDNKEITAAVKQAIEGAIAKGICVVPITGRPTVGLPEDLMALEGIRYAATSNGAAVVERATGAVICSDFIDSDTAAAVVCGLMTYEALVEVYFDGACYSDDHMLRTALNGFRLPPAIREYMLKTRNPVNDLPEFIKTRRQPVEKIHAMFDDPEIRLKAFASMEQYQGKLAVTSAAAFNMEINTLTANKGSALMALGKVLSILPEEIMAIGDSGNDYEMIRQAGIGVAMGNAIEEIKDIADFVTLTNEEDGVAFAINKFI